MRIIQVCAEFAPLIKAGGLGEVLVGLTRELFKLNSNVDVIIPKYSSLPEKQLTNLRRETIDFPVFEGNQKISNTMWSAQFENIRLHLLEMDHPAGYFKRTSIYGYPDDAPRFLYFSKATAEYLKIKQQPIDILHLHDWHTASIASLLPKSIAKKTVLSIHNLEHQGKCGRNDLEAVGITGEELHKYYSNTPKYPDSYNILQGGIQTADALIPVSPSYAKEILTPQFGCGLDPILSQNKSKIRGILNGIDETLWNPATDPNLKAPFNPSDPIGTIVKAKHKTQQFLAKHFGLKGAPWIGAITRIVPQKGPEFLEAAITSAVNRGAVFTLLGSSPVPELQQQFEQLKSHYKNHPQVLIQLDFDEPLAHQLYAALDFLLVPSHFEPCGLAQMIGMHYGTVPIVRETGGLKDTVFETNGFTFKEPTIKAFLETLDRALETKQSNPTAFATIMRNGLQTDFSWKKPTQDYLNLFRRLSS